MIVRPPKTAQYRNLFLIGLLASTFLPLAVALLNFEILDKSVLAFVYAFALVQVFGSNHVWMTIGYYFDRRWMAHFKANKGAFFWGPLCIVLVSIGIALQPNQLAWVIFGYGIILLNLWHHAKQNWGIMVMVGRLRQVSVDAMKWPLIWAWPFFLLSAFTRFPMATEGVDIATLIATAQVAAGGYFIVAMGMFFRSALWRSGDPIILLFVVGLSSWFLPMSLLYGKPYNLAVWVGAHALQYYLFVWVSLGCRDRPTLSATSVAFSMARIVLFFVVLTLIAYGLGKYADGSPIPDSLLVRFVVGLIAGVNLSHFWLDALIWKFSDAKVRALHGTAYAF